ncbi:hypothetical protein GIY62_22130 [Burkholderia plantarii]|uniref:hypothetical protein n=1 Tax=Burkholderia plantarii TaxID=41899 RepID=UPI0027299CC2|nr:hypothetical protein [Burkholderia plantarii]WLE63050.1 hypothetical protein GIY62_22130 [Burkholderia plantarii]
MIADPAKELDSGAKAGALVTPLPGPAAVEALITASPPAKIKQLVEAVWNAVGGGDKSQALGGKSIEDLSDAAKVPDVSDKSGELSAAGRALQKHGGRYDSAFPPAKGNPAAINEQGQKIVDSILRTANTSHPRILSR